MHYLFHSNSGIIPRPQYQPETWPLTAEKVICMSGTAMDYLHERRNIMASLLLLVTHMQKKLSFNT